ncbi:FH protein interacting protein FIP2 isoform X2 [Nicotiana tabacum]|uniref:FH protein interacting protein FIP2 isoform X2 n=1 Tax=Nicotiana tabacum TaxID=4097 RepID=A0AC58U3C4_TOBAC
MADHSDSSSSSMVRLNIGGKKFCTTLDTLTQREPDSMLAAMFSGRHTICQESEKGLVDEVKAVLSKRKEDEELGTELTRIDIIKCIQSDRVRFRGINLSGLDLSKLDLSFVDFSYACLKTVFFSRANLQCAKFRDVDAEASIFHNATLRECEFTGANLRGAVLAGANLQSANLQDACLIGCSFCGADLRSAHLQTADLTNANLEGANLEGANLKGAKLTNANLKGANLQRAYLRHVNLRDTHLEGAKLDGANLLGAIR